jgi:peptidoglycan hydrolase-like protein with peptidoglycan-binding domain
LTTHQFAPRMGARTFTIAVTLAVLSMPAHATAQPTRLTSGTVLQQGAGMTGKRNRHVVALQRALREHGHALGAAGVDGRFGPDTASAVRRFQLRSGLTVDGVVGRNTRRALRAVPGQVLGEAASAALGASVRRLQRVLEAHGFRVGATGADGPFGPLTAVAVRRLQQHYGLTPDGVVGARTRRVIDLIARARRARSDRAAPAHGPGTHEPASASTRHPAPDHRGPSTDRTAVRDTAAAPPPARRQATTTSPPAGRTDEDGGTLAVLLALLAALTAAGALSVALVVGLRSSGRHPRAGHRADRADVEALPRVVGEASAITPAGAPLDPAHPAGERALTPWSRADDLKRAHSRLAAGEPVLGYVVTDATADDRSTSRTHDAVRRIEAICAAGEWDLHDVVEERVTGPMFERPGLTFALDAIAADQARGLVVSGGKQLTSSISDLVALLEWFHDVGATLVVDDLDLDAATPDGRRPAPILRAVGRRQSDGARSRRDFAPRTDRPRRTGTSP